MRTWRSGFGNCVFSLAELTKRQTFALPEKKLQEGRCWASLVCLCLARGDIVSADSIGLPIDKCACPGEGEVSTNQFF
jgi:hypothetical protein